MDTSKPLDLLTLDEACAELRIEKTTIYRMMGDGRLPAHRIKGTDKVVVRRADLAAMLEAWVPRQFKKKDVDTDIAE